MGRRGRKRIDKKTVGEEKRMEGEAERGREDRREEKKLTDGKGGRSGQGMGR